MNPRYLKMLGGAVVIAVAAALAYFATSFLSPSKKSEEVVGMWAYSSDKSSLGKVVGVVKDKRNRVTSIDVETSEFPYIWLSATRRLEARSFTVSTTGVDVKMKREQFDKLPPVKK